MNNWHALDITKNLDRRRATHCSMKLSYRWSTLQTGQILRTGYFKLNSNVFWLCLVVWIVFQWYFTYGLNVFSEFWGLKVLFGWNLCLFFFFYLLQESAFHISGLKISSIQTIVQIYCNIGIRYGSYTMRQLGMLGVDVPTAGYMQHHYKNLRTTKFLQERYTLKITINLKQTSNP